MDIEDVLGGKIVILDMSVLTSPGIDEFIDKTREYMVDLDQKYYITRETYKELEREELSGNPDAGDALNLVEDLMNQNMIEVIIPKNKEGVVKLTEISQIRPLLFVTLDKKTALNLEMVNRMKSYTGKPIQVMGINRMGEFLNYGK
ncbi:MAG: hypothetical protein ACLVME_02790 [Ezakiella coagulans]|uniref:hypothetical protein n=1 Tax=Ezakiella coagulans TaxID=46507 RepID=UPI00399BEF1F